VRGTLQSARTGRSLRNVKCLLNREQDSKHLTVDQLGDKVNLTAIVGTWHDDFDSSGLLACLTPGFRLMA
jgi:hypothetical protein